MASQSTQEANLFTRRWNFSSKRGQTGIFGRRDSSASDKAGTVFWTACVSFLTWFLPPKRGAISVTTPRIKHLKRWFGIWVWILFGSMICGTRMSSPRQKNIPAKAEIPSHRFQ
jgi:hypothetical protein